jgi:predicted dehydrogenase
MTAPLRIGVLGTGFIVQGAMLDAAPQVPEVVIDAVGSRSRERAAAFAQAHGIARGMTYEELVADPGIDIVYIALPPTLHAEWSVRALEQGKHVLCEKPVTANAVEARRVAQTVDKTDRVFMEACHYLYHPFTKRTRDILDTGVLGSIQSAEAIMQLPEKFVPPGNSKRDPELGGGALMDGGCYALRGLRSVLGHPVKVIRAVPILDKQDSRVDLAMNVTLEYSKGRQGRFLVSFLGTGDPEVTLRAVGEKGRLEVARYMVPQFGATLRAEWEGRTYTEAAEPTPSYVFQLRELVRCVRDGAPVLTSAEDGLSLMTIMDAIYGAAGLRVPGARA